MTALTAVGVRRVQEELGLGVGVKEDWLVREAGDPLRWAGRGRQEGRKGEGRKAGRQEGRKVMEPLISVEVRLGTTQDWGL